MHFGFALLITSAIMKKINGIKYKVTRFACNKTSESWDSPFEPYKPINCITWIFLLKILFWSHVSWQNPAFSPLVKLKPRMDKKSKLSNILTYPWQHHRYGKKITGQELNYLHLSTASRINNVCTIDYAKYQQYPYRHISNSSIALSFSWS